MIHTLSLMLRTKVGFLDFDIIMKKVHWTQDYLFPLDGVVVKHFMGTNSNPHGRPPPFVITESLHINRLRQSVTLDL